MVHAHPTGNPLACAGRFPRFEIHADHCPQVLARVVGLFAARALIPSELHARQSPAGLWIGLHLDIDRETAERIAEKLRAIVSVAAVILIHAPVPAAGEGSSPADVPAAELRERIGETGIAAPDRL